MSPLVGAVAWVLGLALAVVVFHGHRWRPERVAALGGLGLVAAGVGSGLGWVFAAVAGLGLLWRTWRVTRKLF